MGNKIKNNSNLSMKDLSSFYGLQLDEDQIKFRDAIYDDRTIVVASNSCSGSGKTTVSVGVANILYQEGKCDGIVYIISPNMEHRQGFLPGTIEEKSAKYKEPLIEALLTLGLNPETVIIDPDNPTALKEGKAYIQFTVDTFLRGVNFENKVVIIDEAQNFYFDDLKKTLTRMHDSTKSVLIGQESQCDLPSHKERSGLRIYINAFRACNDSRIAVCDLRINHRGWFSTFCDNVMPDYL